MAKEPLSFIFVVLYDEKTETQSGILGVFNTYRKAREAIMVMHPLSVCIEDNLFEYKTHLYSIHKKTIRGYLPSSA
ncbi:MAG: hypothetical protein PF440_04815 [Thiomicrorhabdus sp.]|jgi:hypothetical protein|nr:hypothetical protein [Thiomicrorhabdus sp.]